MTTTAPAPTRPLLSRLQSLDALRGLTIAFMIMVNNNGSDQAWWFMKHAEWNGLTPTDLVFPTFLFVAGVSTVFALEARLAKGATRAQLAWQTVRRAAILFALGLVVNNLGTVLNNFPHLHLDSWRIYGVLQRIAICYCIVALFYLWDRKWQSKVVVLVAALLGYWILMRWVPVPGAGVPGVDIPFLDKDQNLVAWLDRQIFPGKMLYETTRDPEGLLSDLPALGTALMGLLTGIWLRTRYTVPGKAVGLAAGSAACLALGCLWSIWLPLNKKLWTSSYVLVAAGISLAIFALFFWAMEVNNWKGKWTWPWLVLGANSIFAYMVSEILSTLLWIIQVPVNGKPDGLQRWIWLHGFTWIPNGGLASFAYSFAFMVVCFVPTWLLYKNKVFLKV
jgi:predicted acyltransferase